MEYIFEDFLAGFLENKFSKDWKIEYQKSDEYLSNIPRVFNMQHDIFLTARHGSKRKVIIDTKYKLRQDNFKTDPKKGVAQSDLYQMVSYAFKRGCTDIILVYPNISDDLNTSDNFKIISGFGGADEITITAMEIPFSSLTNFNKLDSMLFETLETQLNKLLQ
jgi:5-methylcytosine-specific restriction enzyme subunit McrC